MVAGPEDRAGLGEVGKSLSKPLITHADHVAQGGTTEWLGGSGEGGDDPELELGVGASGLFAGGDEVEMSVAATGGDEAERERLGGGGGAIDRKSVV